MPKGIALRLAIGDYRNVMMLFGFSFEIIKLQKLIYSKLSFLKT